MTKCEDCWWYGRPIDCPAKFNLDTYECKNFESKENKREWEKNNGVHFKNIK
ncbi:MAG: hypothetical protein J6A49_10650 [Clostridia bacterium]|nr:hypothetical protein [Clostridia bacterium]